MKRSFVELSIGYMLKVLKSRQDTSQFKKEFDAIRHGNYYDFINLIGENINFNVGYNGNTGEITTDVSPKKDEPDFVGLAKAGTSCKVFLEKCVKVYGEWHDNDISDRTYLNLALFEIALRMHAKNNNLLNERETLENVIEKVCAFKGISDDEKSKLHGSRVLINMVKHFKNQYPSWSEGLIAFNEGFEVLKTHNLLIF